jgi:hypothetical protein
MKCGSQFAKFLLPVGLLLAAGLVLWLPHGSQFSAAPRGKEVNDNPEKFHLVASNATYDVSFTYDLRAADEWLFHTGGPVPRAPNLGRLKD